MIELEKVPELVRPVMIAAFEGWNDAGDAASGVITYLAETWKAHELAALDPDDYYDFQVNRPTTTIGKEGTREITWPDIAERLRPSRSYWLGTAALDGSPHVTPVWAVVVEGVLFRYSATSD